MQSRKTIGDLIPDVVDALQGRTDVTTIIPRYVKKAIIEITESNPFEELRKTGPTVSLTTGVYEYPVTKFITPDDEYTSLETMTVFIDYPSNQVKYTVDYKTPKALEPMTSPSTSGPPSKWTRFGHNIHVGPVPDKPYSTYWRYQVKHPFPQNESELKAAQLYIPESWEDIVCYAAAERIAFVKRWNDQRKDLHELLYGDPEFQVSEGKRGRPGLIAARLFQVERDQKFNQRQITPVVARYGAR